MTSPKKIINFESAQKLVARIAGEDAIRVIRIYEKKKSNVTDEELAKKMRLKVTEVRTILNRLHYRGVASYQKSKNNKTGWYSYTWALKSKRIAELLLEEMGESLEKLESKQQIQSNYGLFSCRGRCETIPFEVAAEYEFRCPECGKVMNAMDSKRVLRKTEQALRCLREEMSAVRKSV